MAKTHKYGEETVTIRVPVSKAELIKALLDNTANVVAAAKPKRHKKGPAPMPGRFDPAQVLPKTREECYALGHAVGRATGVTAMLYLVPPEFRDEDFHECHMLSCDLSAVPDEFREIVAVSIMEEIDLSEARLNQLEPDDYSDMPAVSNG